MNDICGAYIEERWGLRFRRRWARPDLQGTVSSDGFSCAKKFLLIPQKKTDMPAESDTTGSIGMAQSTRSLSLQLIQALLKFK